MFQIHLDECDSTQEYFKQNWKQFQAHHPHETHFVVSTTNQAKGIGRRKATWTHFKNNLAFSFNIQAHAQMTLTSLEMGVLLCFYFQKNFGIKPYLKWPNDLINQKREKLGGLLCHLLKEDTVVVGCGLNLSMEESEKKDYSYKLPPGGLLAHPPTHPQFKKTLPYKIAQFIQHNRLSQKEIMEEWPAFCGHLHARVQIGDQANMQEGLFKGIGPQGEALLEILEPCSSGQSISVLSGSLYFLDPIT